MMHEMSQLDIPDSQLQAVNAPPRVSLSREIGEATIIHTMFGKAKVRIIRKTDGRRRALLLLALAAVAWWAWLATQPAEPMPGVASQPVVNEKAPESQSPLPATIAPPAAVPEDKPVTPPASEIAKPAIIQKGALQPAQNVQAATPTPAQPAAPKPLPASKQQTAPPAPGSTPSSTQTVKPLPPTPLPPRQPAPAVVTPRATLSTRPPASSPAMVAPAASSAEGGAASTQTPAAADTSGK